MSSRFYFTSVGKRNHYYRRCNVAVVVLRSRLRSPSARFAVTVSSAVCVHIIVHVYKTW
jgi:hypothetical protein